MDLPLININSHFDHAEIFNFSSLKLSLQLSLLMCCCIKTILQQ